MVAVVAPKKTDLELALAHKYTLGGEKLINVTAISGLMDDGKSNGMAYVAAKLTREGLNYLEVWNAARDLGSRVHPHCESFLRGEAIDCLPEDMGYVDAVEKFLVDSQPEVIALEQIVLSSRGYGGRFDMIVRFTDGTVWLLDLKTGKEYPVEHTLQLSAYRYADGLADYDEAGSLTGLRPMPSIDKCGCLYAHGDGTYDLVEYPAHEWAFESFCALLSARQWAHDPEIRSLVKAAKAR